MPSTNTALQNELQIDTLQPGDIFMDAATSLMCEKWASACKRADKYYRDGDYTSANSVRLEFYGWLRGAMDNLVVIGKKGLAQDLVDLNLFWTYRCDICAPKIVMVDEEI